jgi:hypothetical protein
VGIQSLKGETGSPPLWRVLHGLGMYAARRKRVVVGARVVLALAVVSLVRTFGSNTSDLEIFGTDSQAATDLFAERFPSQQNGSSPIVFHVDTARSLTRRNSRRSRIPTRRS